MKLFNYNDLIALEKPGRYTGGEFGSLQKYDESGLRVCVSFPDLYEVGMSNLAVKILYSRINCIEGLSCERVFAPAGDLEEYLRSSKRPLFSLETAKPINSFDIIAFSVGFELLATNILLILECGNIPVRTEQRTETDPIIIAGGPGITNPYPFSRFLDAVLIGESEEEIEIVLTQCLEVKKRGGLRKEILSVFRSRKCWWYPGKVEKTERNIYHDFGRSPDTILHYPVANIKTVQDHGVIEIMRGCINGCRFCHAGYFYRPCREKSVANIIEEAHHIVHTLGYREISLSSLSSGDYSRLWELLDCLNREFAGEGVSFSLPSLRIDSFSLENLGHLSVVRKSGLTFAVETPDAWMQQIINKSISIDRIIDIIRRAENLGWKHAKFYFMIGLPGSEGKNEADSIIQFIHQISKSCSMRLSVNIGTFVPKPHTPFEGEGQIDVQEAEKKIFTIRDAFRKKRYKIAYHSPFLSYVEGIIARGNEETGELIEKVYAKGARFDSWEEQFRRDIWEDALGDVNANRHMSAQWKNIGIGVSDGFLREELNRSRGQKITPPCEEQCGHPCGACTKTIKLERNRDVHNPREKSSGPRQSVQCTAEPKKSAKYIFSFSKKGKARFLSHLNCMTIFERAFFRAGINIVFSEGFNPKPKMEFAHPLMLGIESEEEIAAFQSTDRYDFRPDLLKDVNEMLPQGFFVLRAKISDYKKSLMSIFAGGRYRFIPRDPGKDAINELYKKLTEYKEKNEEILEEIGIVTTLAEKSVDVVVRHVGKKGNLKTIITYLTGNTEDSVQMPRINEFLRKHSVIRLASYTLATYTKDGGDNLLSFF